MNSNNQDVTRNDNKEQKDAKQILNNCNRGNNNKEEREVQTMVCTFVL